MDKLNNAHYAAQQNGWTYQGVNEQSRVAFYERDGVKMDYYYTTGTTKTSMDHPSKGHTQLFRRDVPVESVMQDPCVHTGEGYYTRAERSRRSGK